MPSRRTRRLIFEGRGADTPPVERRLEDHSHELRHADLLGFLQALLFRPRTEERTPRRGARGEGFAGLVIGRLPDGWLAFNSISDGEHGRNMDHVVVGPAGTFTLNAKSLTGKVWVGAHSVRHNGHPTDFLTKAAHEASRVSRHLTAALGRPIDVHGVVAILADEWTIKERPSDVHVGSPRGVKDWLLRLPPTLSAHEVDQIAAAASSPSTWTLRLPIFDGDQLPKRSVRVRPARSTSSGVEPAGMLKISPSSPTSK
jgi:Nuclease-related domain